MEITAQEVAEWMVKEIRFTGTLHQTAAIEYVKENFGEQFVFVNENGNASLSKEVKKAFRKTPWRENCLGSRRVLVGLDLSLALTNMYKLFNLYN